MALSAQSLRPLFSLFKTHLSPRLVRQHCRPPIKLVKSSLQTGSFRNTTAPTLVAMIPVSCNSLTPLHSAPQQNRLLALTAAELRNKCFIPNLSVVNLEYLDIELSRTNKPQTRLIELTLNRVPELITNKVLPATPSSRSQSMSKTPIIENKRSLELNASSLANLI